jgi:nicotinamidase-related amidase
MTESFAGFGFSSGMGKRPCMIVVDYIKGFTDPSCQLGSDYTNEITNTKKLLDAARQQQMLIVFTTVMYEPHYKDGGYFLQKVPALKVLTSDSDWIQIDPRLERREAEEPLIVKKFASAFFGTNLQSLLTGEQIDTTIVVGCTTSGCVRATVVDALQYGYRVVVPESCVGDRSQAAHKANLYDMSTKYADVVDLDTVISYVEQINMQAIKGE